MRLRSLKNWPQTRIFIQNHVLLTSNNFTILRPMRSWRGWKWLARFVPNCWSVWAEAVQCYEQALAADQLAENFYQGLMRCHIALNRPAEGLSVYRKMRQALSIVLGIEPSSHSQTLARQLTDQAPLSR